MGDYETSVSIAKQVQEFFDETHKEYAGAVGGQYSYTFTQKSLGTILEIRDGFTGRTINATNFNDW
jgi:hypothetical protein